MKTRINLDAVVIGLCVLYTLFSISLWFAERWP